MGDGQFIVGPGKVIHADVDVAFSGQLLNGELENFQFRFRGRQGFLFENALPRFDPGHMGVVENSETIRAQEQHLVEGFFKRSRRLMRQTVNEIEVDGVEFHFAEPINRLLGHFARLP